MPLPPELLAGVKKALAAGRTPAEIEQEMLANGWSRADAAVAFRQLGIIANSSVGIRRSRWPFVVIIVVLLLAGVAAGGYWLRQNRFEPLGIREVAAMIDCGADSECLVSNLQNCQLAKGSFTHRKEDSGFTLTQEHKLINYGFIENECVFDFKLLSGELTVPVGTPEGQIQMSKKLFIENRLGKEATCMVPMVATSNFMRDLLTGQISFSSYCSGSECTGSVKEYPEVRCRGAYFDFNSKLPQVDLKEFLKLNDERVENETNQRCSRLADLTDHEKFGCLKKIAADTKNPNVCAQLPNSPEAWRDNCYVGIAPIIKDYSVCEQIKLVGADDIGNYAKEHNYNSCRTNVASALDDAETCRSMMDSHRNI